MNLHSIKATTAGAARLALLGSRRFVAARGVRHVYEDLPSYQLVHSNIAMSWLKVDLHEGRICAYDIEQSHEGLHKETSDGYRAAAGAWRFLRRLVPDA